jgi:hypothetical protein
MTHPQTCYYYILDTLVTILSCPKKDNHLHMHGLNHNSNQIFNQLIKCFVVVYWHLVPLR